VIVGGVVSWTVMVWSQVTLSQNRRESYADHLRVKE
jgi:hypothetical protein